MITHLNNNPPPSPSPKQTFTFDSHSSDLVLGGLHVPITMRTCHAIEENFRGVKGREQVSRLYG